VADVQDPQDATAFALRSAAFDTSPAVVGGKVLIGNRDGCFYAFDAKSGQLAWHYRAEGPISYSEIEDARNS